MATNPQAAWENIDMETEHEGPGGHPGLPVKGYRPQSQNNVAIVDEHKVLEERVLRRIEMIGAMPDMDARMAALAKTKVQEAFMWLNRAVFKPTRVDLPEDDNGTPD